MTGIERIKKAFRCEKVDRVPWIPFVGCHGGRLIGVSAGDYLRSADHIVRGQQLAIDRYRPDGLPVVFDLQIEAEVFGCRLRWAEENPPSVQSHPLAEGVALGDIPIPAPTDGRVKVALDATRRLRKANPDIALYGLITGPFTLVLHLMGTDIFMKMFDAPEEIAAAMRFASEVGKKMAEYYVDAGCDVIAVVDPMTSQIGPEQFREFVSPHIEPVFERIRAIGALSSFFVCGHAQQNIVAMCETRPDNVSVDENIPLDYVRDECVRRGISFGGNLQLTTVLLLGGPEDAMRNAAECMQIGGTTGYILAPGCDLPYATPPENLEAVAKVVQDPYQHEVAKTLAEKKSVDILDMKEYGSSDKVIVDVITLDSEGCAPCQYMVEAVKSVTPEFAGIVEWREHKIKYRESLVFMTSLMVKNIPTICIDGKITFVSRIPAQDELIRAIQKRIYEKLRLKIQRKKAELVVLGDGGAEFAQLKVNVEKAVKELGADVNVIAETERSKVEEYGVVLSQTPAVVLARYQLKSARTVPDVRIIKEWLKDI